MENTSEFSSRLIRLVFRIDDDELSGIADSLLLDDQLREDKSVSIGGFSNSNQRINAYRIRG